ncbi:outer membrane beta-barrel protein [Sinobacterium caligoides]|nr:outer membrane beta-barrel protein [Sinobacterium caligoides]
MAGYSCKLINQCRWTASCLLVFCTTATADNAYYLGLLVGSGEVEVVGHDRRPQVAEVLREQGDDVTVVAAGEPDGTNTAVVYGGYQFSRNVAVELSYADLGETKGSFSALQASTEVLEGTIASSYQALALAAVIDWPITRRWSLQGRLGAHRWRHRFELAGEGVRSDSSEQGFGLLYGFAVQCRLFDRYYIGGHWQRFDNVEQKEGVDMKALGIHYRF